MSPDEDGKSTWILAVDTGGTFTDLLLFRGDGLEILKVRSTPADPAEAVLEGARRLLGRAREAGGAGGQAGKVDGQAGKVDGQAGKVDGQAGGADGEAGGAPPFLLLHGSTVATNALLERKGARVVLVTNRGFEDVIEIGRQNRPQLYALVGHRLPSLVARDDRVGIAGRLGPGGEEIERLDPAELDALQDRVSGAEALAVALLHSYAEARHERKVAEALRGVDLPLSVSSELLPEYREYERTSTTVVNAYVQPLVSRYLERIEAEAGARSVRVMGSDGGALPVGRAVREPVHTVLSGPAGGVVGARRWAGRAGFERVITFDMGGTSTDVSLCPGRALHTRELEIADQPVAVPVIDIHTVGAGGGSLARRDPGGALRVGPLSAGADPGPICYGRGGTGLTVTDAHVWLGRLPPDAFLGGDASLDRDAIRKPLETLARELGLTPDEAAEGILAVADSAMERALRVISVERGYDPAEFVVVAFGGAGALHVAELASRLGAARALVPPDPGLLSAYGILAAPVTRETSRTVLLATDEEGAEAEVRRILDDLREDAAARMEREGHARELLEIRTWVDARYRGQSYELRVEASRWVEAFHRVHRERYGYSREGSEVEAVTLRAVAVTPGVSVEPPTLSEAGAPPPTEPTRVVHRGRSLEARRVRRSDLRGGHVLRGPTVVTEYSSTTWLPPGWSLRVDAHGTLELAPER